MKRAIALAFGAVATLGVAGCATTDIRTAEERAGAKADKVYVTGSRIPRKGEGNESALWALSGTRALSTGSAPAAGGGGK